jgi:hypothetical protein
MPRSRNRPKRQLPLPKRRQWDWRRAAGGWAEFVRNLALLLFGAPFVEPLLSGAALDAPRALFGIGLGLALLLFSSILDHERRDR